VRATEIGIEAVQTLAVGAACWYTRPMSLQTKLVIYVGLVSLIFAAMYLSTSCSTEDSIGYAICSVVYLPIVHVATIAAYFVAIGIGLMVYALRLPTSTRPDGIRHHYSTHLDPAKAKSRIMTIKRRIGRL
jgi:hypothetical protein